MSRPPFENFHCDNCGACCRTLLVEAGYIDAQREPRLYTIGTVDKAKLRTGEHCIILYDQERQCCPFLSETNRCGIYHTRPNECVCVEPGDAKCQQARYMQGLPLLRDADGNEPTIAMLSDSCEDYGLTLEEIGIE